MSVTDIQDAGPQGGRTAQLRAKGERVAQAAKAKTAQARAALNDGARRSVQVARDQAAATGRKLSAVTQERPLTSLSTAIAVGLLVGVALGLFASQASAGWRSGR
ncbi:hypothetical protein [Phenylobacterium sp.]|uniref:hypothetical protein n=1 Tax=Phenylobacterium sp. TaxID=1871053 RepID=UPI00260A6759|nr:hypothetical protein [Phenylobacterium sp.]